MVRLALVGLCSAVQTGRAGDGDGTAVRGGVSDDGSGGGGVPDNGNGSTGGGSDGPVTGDFGTLALSGPDTAVVGTKFVADIAFDSVGSRYGPGALTWSGQGQASERFHPALQILLLGSEAVGVSLAIPDPERADPMILKTLSWREPCDTGAPCNNIRLNVGARSVGFQNVTLGVASEGGSRATAPITLNGTLTW